MLRWKLDGDDVTDESALIRTFLIIDGNSWNLDSRIKTRRLREVQHNTGYIVQRAHSHITTCAIRD